MNFFAVDDSTLSNIQKMEQKDLTPEKKGCIILSQDETQEISKL